VTDEIRVEKPPRGRARLVGMAAAAFHDGGDEVDEPARGELLHR
jgi:hypothetical protein